MLKKFVWSIVSIALYNIAFAQTYNRCYTDEMRQKYLLENADLYQQLQQVEQAVLQYQTIASSGSNRAVITIPVVVHVVHDGDAVGISENIAEAQIQSQIDILNEDYRKLNADTNNTPSIFKSVSADIEIEFCLAQRDPSGNPSNGITRHNFNQASFTINDIDNTIKPQTVWDRNKYLNIWTVRFSASETILGYSSQPGFPADVDGVVVGYEFFGNTGTLRPPYNKGRTTTHEIGHWLGLFHTWGSFGGCNDDDNIADTPESSDPYYGCPSFPQNSCNTSNMFMNYMDYTNDACMNLFTQGQKVRMNAILNSVRTSILTSDGCVAVPVEQLDAALIDIVYPGDNICQTTFEPIAEIRNNGTETITSLLIVYQLNSGALQQFQWNGNLPYTQSVFVTLPQVNVPLGNNQLLVSISNVNQSSDDKPTNNEQIITFNVSNSNQIVFDLPFQEGFENNTFPPNTFTIQNFDGDVTWQKAAVGGKGTSLSSTFMDNFSGTVANNPRNTTDALISVPFNFFGTNAQLRFDVAYARRTNNSKDSLIVSSSTDCGVTWKRIFAKGGASLATADNTNQAFTPDDTSWVTQVIGLNNLALFPYVQFKFENKSDWGNNLYLDNINLLSVPTGVAENKIENVLSVFPNPAKNFFSIYFENKINLIEITIYDMLGKQVYHDKNTQSNSITVHTQSWNKGLYMLVCNHENGITQKKILIE